MLCYGWFTLVHPQLELNFYSQLLSKYTYFTAISRKDEEYKLYCQHGVGPASTKTLYFVAPVTSKYTASKKYCNLLWLFKLVIYINFPYNDNKWTAGTISNSARFISSVGYLTCPSNLVRNMQIGFKWYVLKTWLCFSAVYYMNFEKKWHKWHNFVQCHPFFSSSKIDFFIQGSLGPLWSDFSLDLC